MIVDALLYKEDATDLLDHIKNKKFKTCSLIFTRTLRAKISSISCVCHSILIEEIALFITEIF